MKNEALHKSRKNQQTNLLLLVWRLFPFSCAHEMLLLVMISHYVNAQGVPINAAEVSKCHFTEVRGTSHFFPRRFTVGSNTTQQPSQDFEIKLEDAVNSRQEKPREKVWLSPCESQLVSDSPLATHGRKLWQPSCTGQRGGGLKLSPHQGFFNPLSLDPVSFCIADRSIRFNLTQATDDLSFPDLFLWDLHHQFNFCTSLVLCLQLSLHLKRSFS